MSHPVGTSAYIVDQTDPLNEGLHGRKLSTGLNKLRGGGLRKEVLEDRGYVPFLSVTLHKGTGVILL